MSTRGGAGGFACEISGNPAGAFHNEQKPLVLCVPRCVAYTGPIDIYDIDNRYDCVMAKAELLQGTLDLLILRTLEPRPLHGVGISDRIAQVTKDVFVVGPGSLFPALHRLAEKGWIDGQWDELEENGRRAKIYSLTRSGKAQLTQEKRNWHKIFTAVNQVLTEDT